MLCQDKQFDRKEINRKTLSILPKKLESGFKQKLQFK
jgi:hypothetical protein